MSLELKNGGPPAELEELSLDQALNPKLAVFSLNCRFIFGLWFRKFRIDARALGELQSGLHAPMLLLGKKGGGFESFRVPEMIGFRGIDIGVEGLVPVHSSHFHRHRHLDVLRLEFQLLQAEEGANTET